MKVHANSIRAVQATAAIQATEVYFVPGVGSVEAANLEDLATKLEALKHKKPAVAKKVEDGDGNK